MQLRKRMKHCASAHSYPKGRRSTPMIAYTKKHQKKIVVWLLVLLTLVVGGIAALGFNTLDGSVDLVVGFNTLADMFGGLTSLGGIALVIVALVALVAGQNYVINGDFSGRPGMKVAILIATVAIPIAAAIVGLSWVNLGENYMSSLVILLVAVVFTTLVTWAILRAARPTVASTPVALVDASRADHHTSSVA